MRKMLKQQNIVDTTGYRCVFVRVRAAYLSTIIVITRKNTCSVHCSECLGVLAVTDK